MNDPIRGIVAGLIATVVLSAIMLIKSGVGLLPDLNAIRMLTGVANELVATPQTPVVGWLLHFVIGALWGLLFVWIAHRLPFRSMAAKGAAFSVGPWVLMMLFMMPVAGAGFFALGISPLAPVATLILHLVFGAVLGAVYAALPESGRRARASVSSRP